MLNPNIEVPRITAIHIKVFAAFLGSGFSNAGTPSATASTPVRATAPDENALRKKNRVNAFCPDNNSWAYASE